MDPNVTVVMPFDWLGSFFVPVAAILVSAGIAISLAGLERRAAKRDRQVLALAEVVVALTGVNAVATDRVRRSEVARRLTRFVAAVNVAAAHFDRDDAVFELVITMVQSEESAGRRNLGLAAARAMALLDRWRHGRISNDSIAAELAAYPPGQRGYRA